MPLSSYDLLQLKTNVTYQRHLHLSTSLRHRKPYGCCHLVACSSAEIVTFLRLTFGYLGSTFLLNVENRAPMKVSRGVLPRTQFCYGLDALFELWALWPPRLVMFSTRHSQTQFWSLSLYCHYRLSIRASSCEFQQITVHAVAATAQSHQINGGDRTGNPNTARTLRGGDTRIQNSECSLPTVNNSQAQPTRNNIRPKNPRNPSNLYNHSGTYTTNLSQHLFAIKTCV